MSKRFQAFRQTTIIIESYTYDNLNQLKTATLGNDLWEYTYDNGGNILSVKKNGMTKKTYTYGNSEWKDLLTSYNGETIYYDEIGNPTLYRDNMTFSWCEGRRLSTATHGTNCFTYNYNQDGLRVSKVGRDLATDKFTYADFYWLNGKLQGERVGSRYTVFLYDQNGNPYGFYNLSGSESGYYYYIFNVQGDVIGILDSTGTQVVEYTYNPWGEVLSITGTMADTIGQQNPLRYRGYYYDNETGLYYLQSRYYDPVTGRFINADGYVSTGQDLLGYNMFAYCGNNPVMYCDPTGLCAGGAIFKMVNTIIEKISASINGILTIMPPTQASDDLVQFLTSYESFSPTVYLDSKGNPTIGYGHLIKEGENFTFLTQSAAFNLFKNDLKYFENTVNSYAISNGVKWNQNQFDAMVSVAFNSGPKGFKNIADKIIVGWDPQSAFTSIYSAERARQNLSDDLGLWRRRMNECDIFLYGNYIREERIP